MQTTLLVRLDADTGEPLPVLRLPGRLHDGPTVHDGLLLYTTDRHGLRAAKLP